MMYFENEKVWQKVLKTCEPDTSVHVASKTLKNLPLEYILGINPSLNYLKSFLYELEKFYTVLCDDLRHNALSVSIKMSSTKEFVTFGEKLNIFSMRNNHIENATGLFVKANDYLESQLSSQHMASHTNAILTIKSALRTTYEDEELLLSKIGTAASYHNLCLLPTLNFLASGVYMNVNTSEEEVRAWLYVFDLFSSLKLINDKIV